jgi:tetratricopeptide (TPR) repeat protein
MFSNTIRLLLILGCLLAGIIGLFRSRPSRSILLFAAAALLAYGYFRYGSVWLISRHVRKGEMDKAERMLGTIKNPQLLAPQQKGYYYLYKGAVEQQKGNLEGAKSSYLDALAEGAMTANNKSIANLNLASIYYRQGMLEQAKERLREAKEVPHKREVEYEIEELGSKLRAEDDA